MLRTWVVFPAQELSCKHTQDVLDITALHDEEKTKLGAKIRAMHGDHECELNRLRAQFHDREVELRSSCSLSRSITYNLIWLLGL